jgi:TPR repeat protein
MGKSFYLQSYQAASRRWAQGAGDSESEWQEWVEALGKIKRAWKWSVNGMLTQLDREDPEIWHALGEAYHGGHGVERDVEQAEKWLRMAANANHVRSMTRLGMLLFRDERSDEDKRESLDWYRRAAELGDSSGMISMGLAYREGRCVPVDEKKAVEWFIKAHEAGARNAADLAGRLLSYHAESHLEAVKWLRIAVENGNDLSYSSLAHIHADRQSPAHDPEEAFQCWLQLAERPRGDLRLDAMYWLARSCRDGIGTVRNHDEAKRWLDRIIAVAPKDKSDYRHAVKLRREIDEELF